MSTFVLTAAFYGIFSINRWSFSIFLTLQGVPWVRPEALVCTDYATAWQVLSIIASSCWGAQIRAMTYCPYCPCCCGGAQAHCAICDTQNLLPGP